MKDRWSDAEAASFVEKYRAEGEDVALRTYTARLIGRDPALVLHGGGNTSVKSRARTLTGEEIPVIYMKGSGWDLGAIEPAGHPAIRLEPLQKLRALDRVSDEDMVNAQRCNMLDAAGPNPSVETLLHAFLPHKFIDHTHADAILSLTNQTDGEARVRAWAKGRLGVVPYIMPGFALAKLAAEVFEKDRSVEGLVLLKHGIFTFGETARESYQRMVRWVGEAEALLAAAKPFSYTPAAAEPADVDEAAARAAAVLRGHLARRRPAAPQDDPLERVIVRRRTSPAILRFAGSREAGRLSQQGPATPDHVIRTKGVPLLLPPFTDEGSYGDGVSAAVDAFTSSYEAYFKRQTEGRGLKRRMLDPLPRVALAPGLGLFAMAADAKAADVALDIYEHTIDVIEKASRIGRYEALPEDDLFDMEYWSLEQAKLGKAKEKPLSRRVAWISGAASGIGLACARVFLDAGAHVFLTDVKEGPLREATENLKAGRQAAWGLCDVTDTASVRRSFRDVALAFGGVDVAISNAGAAPTGAIADCSEDALRKSFELNFFGHQRVAQAAAAVFRRQGTGGCLLFNASKSAFNPGPGFGPYALPKAGVVALMRQYAVELGDIGVRSNAVNADRVNTGLYAGGLLEKRAQARGVTVKEYLSGNLVGEEVTPEDVAQGFLVLALARKTTGAVLPVDGGNAAAFPR